MNPWLTFSGCIPTAETGQIHGDSWAGRVACRRNHQDLILPGECSDLTGHSPQLDIDLTAKLNRDLAELPLSHAAITLTSSSSDPGVGQKQVKRVLREARELCWPKSCRRLSGPNSMAGQTPLKRTGVMSTQQWRNQSYRDPALLILLGD